MKSAYFIMHLWQTGNVGSHNISKITHQEKEGYATYDLAKQEMIRLKLIGNWQLNCPEYTFCIMEIFGKL